MRVKATGEEEAGVRGKRLRVKRRARGSALTLLINYKGNWTQSSWDIDDWIKD